MGSKQTLCEHRSNRKINACTFDLHHLAFINEINSCTNDHENYSKQNFFSDQQGDMRLSISYRNHDYRRFYSWNSQQEGRSSIQNCKGHNQIEFEPSKSLKDLQSMKTHDIDLFDT